MLIYFLQQFQSIKSRRIFIPSLVSWNCCFSTRVVSLKFCKNLRFFIIIFRDLSWDGQRRKLRLCCTYCSWSRQGHDMRRLCLGKLSHGHARLSQGRIWRRRGHRSRDIFYTYPINICLYGPGRVKASAVIIEAEAIVVEVVPVVVEASAAVVEADEAKASAVVIEAEADRGVVKAIPGVFKAGLKNTFFTHVL